MLAVSKRALRRPQYPAGSGVHCLRRALRFVDLRFGGLGLRVLGVRASASLVSGEDCIARIGCEHCFSPLLILLGSWLSCSACGSVSEGRRVSLWLDSAR